MKIQEYRYNVAVTLWKVSNLFYSEVFVDEVHYLREHIIEKLYRRFDQNEEMTASAFDEIETYLASHYSNPLHGAYTEDENRKAAVIAVREMCTKLFKGADKE